MNDTTREEWVNNLEPLYNAYKASRKSMRRFLREHRAEIDSAINAELNRKPAR